MSIKIIFQPTEEETKGELNTIMQDIVSTIVSDIQNS